MADLENSKWPPQKNLIFQLRQFSIFFCKNSRNWFLEKVVYRGSSLSTIFGILKKSYYAKFVLVSTTQPISTSTNFTTQQFHQSPTSTNFIPMAIKFVLVEIVLVETVLVETVLVGDPLYFFSKGHSTKQAVQIRIFGPSVHLFL